MTYEEALVRIGVDTEPTLRRFSGDADMMRMFIMKFPEDKNIALLRDALARKDYRVIEDASHTLKGSTGNLGFTALYARSAELCNAVRAKDFERADALGPQVLELCDNISSIISSI